MTGPSAAGDTQESYFSEPWEVAFCCHSRVNPKVSIGNTASSGGLAGASERGEVGGAVGLGEGLIQAAEQPGATQANAVGFSPGWGVLGDQV